MREILRCRTGHREQAPERHREAAIAVDHDHAPVGTAERQPEAMRGGEAHGADRIIIQRMRPQEIPVQRRAVDGDDDRLAGMRGHDLEGLVMRDHAATGLRAIRMATGRDAS